MVAFAAMGLPMLVLGTSVDLLLLSVAFAGTGAALSVLDLAWNMTVQEKVPEEMLSRIQSIDGFFSFVGMPVGQLLVGPLALALGTRNVELACAGLCVVVAVVALHLHHVYRLRPDPDTVVAGHMLARRVIEDYRRDPGKRHQIGLHNGQRYPGGHPGIHGVAASAQHPLRGPGSDGMSGGHCPFFAHLHPLNAAIYSCDNY